MASSRVSKAAFGILVCAILLPALAHAAHSPAPAPAPAPAHTNDGTSIDQGIAYLLMVLALVLTYLIHSSNVTSTF